MISTSCGGLESRLAEAAGAKGKFDAGIEIPPQPADCEKTEPHAPIGEGMEARAALRRERAALDRQNARGARCWQHNENVRARFAAPH